MALSRPAAIRAFAVVTAINVLVASGFSITGLVDPQAILPVTAAPNQASAIFAMYAAARSVPLAFFALWAIYRGANLALLILGALAGVIQVLDAGIGLVQHDMGKTIGPLVIAALQFVAFRRARVRSSLAKE